MPDGQIGEWPADKVEQEVWMPIPDAENYEASSFGRIRSKDFISADGRKIKGRVLKPWVAAKNYLYVSLGKSKKGAVHRFVCLAFHGVPDKGFEVSHLDGNSKNNNLENLKWVTHSENEQQKRKHGTYNRPKVFKKPHHKKRGPKPRRHSMADRIVSLRNDGVTISELANIFGMSKSGMYGVLKWRI